MLEKLRNYRVERPAGHGDGEGWMVYPLIGLLKVYEPLGICLPSCGCTLCVER